MHQLQFLGQMSGVFIPSLVSGDISWIVFGTLTWECDCLQTHTQAAKVTMESNCFYYTISLSTWRMEDGCRCSVAPAQTSLLFTLWWNLCHWTQVNRTVRMECLAHMDLAPSEHRPSAILINREWRATPGWSWEGLHWIWSNCKHCLYKSDQLVPEHGITMPTVFQE